MPPRFPYHHYKRWHYRGGSMFGRLFFFLVGVYSGVVANQRYHIPRAPLPGEAWEEAKSRREESRQNHENCNRSRAPFFTQNQEIREIIDRLKELERKYRKNPSAPTSPEHETESRAE